MIVFPSFLRILSTNLMASKSKLAISVKSMPSIMAVVGKSPLLNSIRRRVAYEFGIDEEKGSAEAIAV